jgi:hypothetical protein
MAPDARNTVADSSPRPKRDHAASAQYQRGRGGGKKPGGGRRTADGRRQGNAGGGGRPASSGGWRGGGDGGKRGPKRPSGGGKFKRPSGPGGRPLRERADDNRQPRENEQLDKARRDSETAIRSWLDESAALRAASANRPKAPPDQPPSLDPWQQDVFDALQAGSSVIVDAPTTAGKTRAVEVFFRLGLSNPLFRAAYTTPVKSLSNDKLREFREMFGRDNVGIATGDIKENLGAPIVVATLESYRNSLLGTEPDLGRTLVVFDEYHYLQDEGRGSAWEEAIILTPAHCQILMLSASVENAPQFAEWVQSLGEGRRCTLIRTEKRPVPLVNLVRYGRDWLLPETLPKNAFKMMAQERLDKPLRQEDLVERLAGLPELELTPCIVYAGRRLACETLAWLLTRVLPPLEPEAAERIGASLQKSHEEVGALSFIQPKLRQMIQHWGVAFHHSGLAAPARIAVEALVKQGLLRFCTATMGLSLGINFSVRSAVVSDYERPGEAGFTAYAPSEVLQMLGRAGRRGKDAVGFSLWPTLESYHRMGNARREPIRSRLRNDPTTFLGLVGRGFSLRAIEGFYGKSFMRFVDKHADFSLFHKGRLARELGMRGREDELPCQSPAAELARFLNDDPTSACHSCKLQDACHALLERLGQNPLAALHVHLHRIGALERNESLTEFGRIARYFPQAGGLLMARMLTDGRIRADNVAQAAELAGTLALARFKEPGGGSRYQHPFSLPQLEKELQQLYPEELFSEIYDQPYGRRSYPVIREFNPAGGAIVRAWLSTGLTWKELIQEFTTEQYGTGDVMSLLYRVGTYLTSMMQADLRELRPLVGPMREALLREPLSFALSI